MWRAQTLPNLYDQDKLSALEAITEAQKIAFAPFLFQASWALRELGILSELDKAADFGCSIEELSKTLQIDPYGISVLLDMGLSGKLVWKTDERFYLSKVGHFILNDKMTRTNMDFTQHVCYQPISYIVESIRNGKPEGLKVFGDWETIYPGLSSLPEPAKSTWFEFDHFYSDQAFNEALPHVFANAPTELFDIGGNTGKWALRCIDYNPDVHVSILDLPEQIELAQQMIKKNEADKRISAIPVNVLTTDGIPPGANVYWMSQFLDCFSEQEIIHILGTIRASMDTDARVFIMELFWDRQRFEGAAFSMNAISLYFTCLANGNSRFYRSEDMLRCIEQAGFSIEKDIDGLGFGHTLLQCKAN